MIGHRSSVASPHRPVTDDPMSVNQANYTGAAAEAIGPPGSFRPVIDHGQRPWLAEQAPPKGGAQPGTRVVGRLATFLVPNDTASTGAAGPPRHDGRGKVDTVTAACRLALSWRQPTT